MGVERWQAAHSTTCVRPAVRRYCPHNTGRDCYQNSYPDSYRGSPYRNAGATTNFHSLSHHSPRANSYCYPAPAHRNKEYHLRRDSRSGRNLARHCNHCAYRITPSCDASVSHSDNLGYTHANAIANRNTSAHNGGYSDGYDGRYSYDTGYRPEFPGEQDFAGTIIHPQHWPEDLDYAGKKIVVTGTPEAPTPTATIQVPSGAGDETPGRAIAIGVGLASALLFAVWRLASGMRRKED